MLEQIDLVKLADQKKIKKILDKVQCHTPHYKMQVSKKPKCQYHSFVRMMDFVS